MTYVIVHRTEETASGALRIVESGIFDPEAEGNPAWVADSLDAAATAKEPKAKPVPTEWESSQEGAAQPSSQIDARPFGGVPDAPVEDTEPSAEVAGAAARAALAAQDEPAEDDEEASATPPPKDGKGSTVAAWAAYAQAHDVVLTDGMKRDDIIAACQAADVPTE